MAKATAVAIRPKVPLAIAATDLARLCDEIDAGAAPEKALVPLFKETRLDLADAVDRRIKFFELVEDELAHARSRRAGWDAKVQHLKALEEAMRAQTKAIVEAQPDLPYEGQLGKFSIQKNGGVAPLTTTWGDKELSQELVETFGVDERYFYAVTTYKLRPEVIVKDLSSGVPIEWAQLAPRGTHLRIKEAP